VKATGMQRLESLKDLLMDEEYKKCKSSKMLGKTWFDLTTDVFIAFLFRVRDPYTFYLIPS
jgi:hypothetical protein